MLGKLGLGLAAAVVGVACSSHCRADSLGTFTATLTGASPADIVYVSDAKYGYNDLAVYAGELDWKVTSSTTALVPAQTTIGTYCVDIVHEIDINSSYHYSLDNDLSTLASVGNSSTISSELQTLWHNDYKLSLLSNDNAAAFQIAIWQILYGADPLTITVYGGESGWTANEAAWLSAAETGTQYASPGLYAMDGDPPGSTQDQGLGQVSTPLPKPALAGAALVGLLGLTSVRRRTA